MMRESEAAPEIYTQQSWFDELNKTVGSTVSRIEANFLNLSERPEKDLLQ